MPNLDLFLKTQPALTWDTMTTEQKISFKLKVDEVLSDSALAFINGLPADSRVRALGSELAKRGYRPAGYNQRTWSDLVRSAWSSIYGPDGEVQRIINAFNSNQEITMEEALTLVPDDGIISADEVQTILDQSRSASSPAWQDSFNTLLDVYKAHYGDYVDTPEEVPPEAAGVVLNALLNKDIKPNAMIRDTILVLGQSGIKVNAVQANSILLQIEQLGSAIRDTDIDMELGRPSLESVQTVLGNNTPMSENVLDALKSIGFWKEKYDGLLAEQEAVRLAEEEALRQAELIEQERLRQEALAQAKTMLEQDPNLRTTLEEIPAPIAASRPTLTIVQTAIPSIAFTDAILDAFVSLGVWQGVALV